MELASLAHQAVELLKSCRPEAGKILAEKSLNAASIGALGLWAWLSKKLRRGASVEALHDAAGLPEIEENWEVLRLQIIKAMKEDQEFQTELSRMIAAIAPPASRAVKATVTGDANAIAQVFGDKNSVNVSGPK